MNNRDVRGRLAPSPTGALHLGNARSFLLAWLSIRSQGGTVILRIEDLDHPKVKAEYIDQIYEDLKWLGLDWDEGPDIGGPHNPYIQTARIEKYAKALRKLEALQCVYPCICSRKDVENAQSAPHLDHESPVYSGCCRHAFKNYALATQQLPKGRIPAWRFRIDDACSVFEDRFCGKQQQNIAEAVGDFVIARHERGAGYMLAVVVDDHLMGVTEVLRGDDLLLTTHRQLILQKTLNYPPPSYVHVPLVVAEDGRRLAKRHGDTRISQLRTKGLAAEKVVGLLAYWSGLAAWDEKISAYDLIHRYRLQQIPRSPAVLTQKVKEFLEIQ